MKNGRSNGHEAPERTQVASESAPEPTALECGGTQPEGMPATDGQDAALEMQSEEELVRQYRQVPFPLGDPEGERKSAKKMHLNRVGANILQKQTGAVLNGGALGAVIADAFLMSIMNSVQTRDAIEEMLCIQMAWTHARLGKLSALAADQTSTKNVQVVNEACDRAANTFRRQMLALSEYRNPRRGDTFTAIKQQNIANQQVVQNAENQNPQTENVSNEQGSPAPAPPAQLPSHEVGTGIPTSVRREEQPLATEHRAENARRQEPLQAQRTEARRA